MYYENNKDIRGNYLKIVVNVYQRKRAYNQISPRMVDEVDLVRPKRRKSKPQYKGRYRRAGGGRGAPLARVSNAQVS